MGRARGVMDITAVMLKDVLKQARRIKSRKRVLHKLRLLPLFFIFFSVACSPSSPEKKRSPLILDIRVDKDVNPDRYGQPAPVNIAIYRMKTSGFINDDMTELQDFGKNKNTERIFSAVFQPGETRHLKLPVMPDTLAIGITGEFRDIEHAQWKSVQQLPDMHALPWWKRIFIPRDNTLHATVHRLGLILTDME